MEWKLGFSEVRVLGCLMEKEMTTPDIYPLTLNSLVAACNQKSNRDPVVEFDEKEVLRALEGLREKHLAMRLDIAGSRVPKYRHTLAKLLPSPVPQTALFCVLLLRGPQTVGELRSRSERMHAFPDLSATQEALHALIEEYAEPFVATLPRQSGRKEIRYCHLLSGMPEISDEPTTVRDEPAALELASERESMVTLQSEISGLRDEVAALTAQLEDLRGRFAEFQAQFE